MMKMPSQTVISVVIISGKKQVMTELGEVPVPFEVVIDRSAGLGLARNNGARRAKNNLIVFVNDDVKLDRKVWNIVLATKDREMTLPLIDVNNRTGGQFANSRVLAIHKKDFWSLGGFDESLKVSCEDRDLYYRARRHLFTFRLIPFEYITHIPHPIRESNIHKSIQGIRDRAKVFSDYAVRHPELFSLDFTPRIKQLQAKFFLIYSVYLLWFIIKKPFGRRKL